VGELELPDAGFYFLVWWRGTFLYLGTVHSQDTRCSRKGGKKMEINKT